jgi:hypothetical protein
MGDELPVTQDDSTNATNYVLFNVATSGSLAPKVDSGLYYNPSTGVLTVGGITSSGGTITGTRIDPRAVAAGATSGTLTPNSATTDIFNAFGLSGTITVATPSGTPVDGQRLVLRFKDNGTGRVITWTTSSGAFRAMGGITLPTTTVTSNVTYVDCVYNSTDVFWDVVDVNVFVSPATNTAIELFTSPAISANAVTLNFSLGAIFALASNSSNITVNFTNIPTTAGQTISISLIISQGAIAYIPNVLTINTASQTIKWQGNTTPSGNINKTDIVSFTFICTATSTYTVIGSLNTYG